MFYVLIQQDLVGNQLTFFETKQNTVNFYCKNDSVIIYTTKTLFIITKVVWITTIKYEVACPLVNYHSSKLGSSSNGFIFTVRQMTFKDTLLTAHVDKEGVI